MLPEGTKLQSGLNHIIGVAPNGDMHEFGSNYGGELGDRPFNGSGSNLGGKIQI